MSGSGWMEGGLLLLLSEVEAAAVGRVGAGIMSG